MSGQLKRRRRLAAPHPACLRPLFYAFACSSLSFQRDRQTLFPFRPFHRRCSLWAARAAVAAAAAGELAQLLLPTPARSPLATECRSDKLSPINRAMIAASSRTFCIAVPLRQSGNVRRQERLRCGDLPLRHAIGSILPPCTCSPEKDTDAQVICASSTLAEFPHRGAQRTLLTLIQRLRGVRIGGMNQRHVTCDLSLTVAPYALCSCCSSDPRTPVFACSGSAVLPPTSALRASLSLRSPASPP